MKTDRSNILRILPLICLQTFLSTGALYGGLMLILDPTGGKLQLPFTFLEGTLFSSYLIPGIILFFTFGLIPAVLIYGLLFKPLSGWADFLNIYNDMHWSWTYSLYIGSGLIIWINVQQIVIKTTFILQQILSLTGLLIIIVCLVPVVKRCYKADKNMPANH
jgi:hypothetical protein